MSSSHSCARAIASRVCASVLDSGPRDDEVIAFDKERGVANTIREVVMVRVQSAQPIDSPAYDLGLTEAEVRARWERHWNQSMAGIPHRQQASSVLSFMPPNPSMPVISRVRRQAGTSRHADARKGTPVMKIVVFDMDGVLCRDRIGRRLALLASWRGKSPEVIHAAIWASGFEDAAERGVISADGDGARPSRACAGATALHDASGRDVYE